MTIGPTMSASILVLAIVALVVASGVGGVGAGGVDRGGGRLGPYIASAHELTTSAGVGGVSEEHGEEEAATPWSPLRELFTHQPAGIEVYPEGRGVDPPRG